MLVILMLAFSLRLYHLDAREIISGEAVDYLVSLYSLPKIVETTATLEQPHPIASYFVTHAWLQVAGDTIFALRFYSLWFALLAVALLFRLAISLKLKETTAKLGSFLLAISPYAISLSQDGRMYSMSLALTIASVWLAIEWLQRQRIRYAIGYVLCATLALYTHYYAAYILLTLYVFVLSRALLYPGLQNSVINLLTPLFFIALLYAPWYEQTATILAKYREYGDSRTFTSLLIASLNTTGVGFSQTTAPQIIWGAVVALCLILAVSMHLSVRNSYSRTQWLLLLYLFLPLLVIWFSTKNRYTVGEHALIMVLPPLLLLLASGREFWRRQNNTPTMYEPKAMDYLWRGHATILTIVMIGMISSLFQYYYEPAINRGRGWQELVTQMRELSSLSSAQRVAFIQFPIFDPELQYYTRNIGTLIQLPVASSSWNYEKLVQSTESEQIDCLVVVLPNRTTQTDIQKQQMVLKNHFQLIAERNVREWRLFVYEKLNLSKKQ